MGTHVVEIRVWTSYPGQFPGQPGDMTTQTLRVQDPLKILTGRIKTIDYLENRLFLLEQRLGRLRFMDRIRKHHFQKQLKSKSSKLWRALKKAVQEAPTVHILEPSGEKFQDMAVFEQRKLPQRLQKATKVECFAIEVDDILENGSRRTSAQAEIKPKP